METLLKRSLILLPLLYIRCNGFSAVISPSRFNKLKSSRRFVANPVTPEVSIENDIIDKLPVEYAEMCKKSVAQLNAQIPGNNKALIHFLTEYFLACSENPKLTPGKAADSFMKAIYLCSKYGMSEKKHKFNIQHKAFRGGEEDNPEGGLDFYEFGCNFFRNSVNLEKSIVLGEDNIRKAFEQVKKGENIVFFANHQSEADPQVVSIMLEKIGMEKEAADLIYVAGHKVTTDPLAIPFSMGRNILCIHSKRHIQADPETKPEKTAHNLATMAAMTARMKEGSAAIWVAPSGGRDRRDLETNFVPVTEFDQKTVDMFRLLSRKSKVKTHFYSMATVSYDLCPPPDSIEAGVGELRNVRYVPVGIAVGEEIPNVGGVESRHLFTEHAEEICKIDYQKLLDSILE